MHCCTLLIEVTKSHPYAVNYDASLTTKPSSKTLAWINTARKCLIFRKALKFLKRYYLFFYIFRKERQLKKSQKHFSYKETFL